MQSSSGEISKAIFIRLPPFPIYVWTFKSPCRLLLLLAHKWTKCFNIPCSLLMSTYTERLISTYILPWNSSIYHIISNNCLVIPPAKYSKYWSYCKVYSVHIIYLPCQILYADLSNLIFIIFNFKSITNFHINVSWIFLTGILHRCWYCPN